MIAAGIAEHESLKLSFTDGKILVNKSNLFQKARPINSLLRI